MNRLLISAAALALCGCMWRTNALAIATTTEVMMFFDAEDYTSDRPNDALRDLCNLFHDEGFVVHIALAGYLAHEIERYGRKDVVEAMRPHLIGTQLPPPMRVSTSRRRRRSSSSTASRDAVHSSLFLQGPRKATSRWTSIPTSA